MSEKTILSIVCVSRPGVLAAVTRRLAELGCNLADTTFAALAGTVEFTAICELPAGLARETLGLEVQRLAEVAGGRVAVGPYEAGPEEAPPRRITHRFELWGPDRPGLLARLSEAFAACGAEVLRLNTQASAADGRHVMRFAVAAPETAAGRLTAAIPETARELGLACRIETA